MKDIRTKSRKGTSIIAIVSFGAAIGGTQAAIIVGATPYLQTSDSPFYAGILANTVVLETFEDGLLNTPGVTASTGFVYGPASNADSVDGDDGSVDGSGIAGKSFFSSAGSAGISFSFDSGVLGGFPQEVGIVWTDGQANSTVNFEAFGPGNVSLGSTVVILGDNSFNGETAEDRFFGVSDSGGVSRIFISSGPSGGIEVDHLQYGANQSSANANIPEPGNILGLAMIMNLGMLTRRRSRS